MIAEPAGDGHRAPEPRHCSECDTDPKVCAHLVKSKGMAGCCGPCSLGDTHQSLGRAWASPTSDVEPEVRRATIAVEWCPSASIGEETAIQKLLEARCGMLMDVLQEWGGDRPLRRPRLRHGHLIVGQGAGYQPPHPAHLPHTWRTGMPTHLLVAMIAAALAILFAVGRLWWIVRRRR